MDHERRLALFDERRRSGPNLWTTLGFRRVSWGQGSSAVAWDATPEYGFPTVSGSVIQGGLVTALLDAAMGGACWTVLDADEAFLTADLRVEFLRATRPGTLTATGTVVRRTRRVVFCEARLEDAEGSVLAASRCTQVVLPADGPAGRYGETSQDGSPPEDARG
ncbi:MAG: hypothetical protein QOE84_3539 [Actinomycetota bacterium]|nr:hypothetical protein [Actinomycetota bacterium]